MIKQKPGGSFFYNHKVRYFKGNAISPWQWLVKTKWNIREEIVWNRGSGPEISGYRFIQIDERIYWLCKGEKHPRLPRRSANYGSVWKFGPEMSNPHQHHIQSNYHSDVFKVSCKRKVLFLILIVDLVLLD